MKQLNPDHIKRYVCRLLPIPYVTKYKDSIHVTKCDDPERIASQFADIKEVFKLEMCIIFGFYFGVQRLELMIKRLNWMWDQEGKDCVASFYHPRKHYKCKVPILVIQKRREDAK